MTPDPTAYRQTAVLTDDGGLEIMAKCGWSLSMETLILEKNKTAPIGDTDKFTQQHQTFNCSQTLIVHLVMGRTKLFRKIEGQRLYQSRG